MIGNIIDRNIEDSLHVAGALIMSIKTFLQSEKGVISDPKPIGALLAVGGEWRGGEELIDWFPSSIGQATCQSDYFRLFL